MPRVLALAPALACLLAGCVTNQVSPTSGQVSSLLVTLAPGTPLGDVLHPISLAQVTFDVTALDDRGLKLARDLDVDVFVSFGGVKTGASGMCGTSAVATTPLATVHLTSGVLTGYTLALPKAYGPTSIWLDERTSHATGASPRFFFDNPHITDVQRPVDPMAPNATFCSQFNNRFIIIDHPTGTGSLVVTSVFSSAFSITDTLDQTNLQPASAFNSIFLYSFGKPPNYIVPGRVLNTFNGNYSKFIGFTELNFPLFEADMTAPLLPHSALDKLTVQLTAADLTNQPKLLGSSASVVEFTGYICNPTPPNPTHDPNVQKSIDSWNKFNEFVLDANLLSPGCAAFGNVTVQLPAKTLGAFDPVASYGNKLTVIGMLQNHSGQNAYLDANGHEISCSTSQPCASGTCIQGTCFKNPYNFWTILPRSAADIVSVGPVM